MARLHELHSAFKSLTAQYHAQQQHLHNQQREAATQQEQQHKARQQDSSSRRAAAAAAAAAVTGLGDKQGRPGRQQQSNQLKLQHKQTPEADQVKLHAKQVSSLGARSSGDHEPPAAAATFQVQIKALQQQYQSSVIGLSAPILSTLALLTDGLVAAGEGPAILGLYTWVQEKLTPVWQGISKMYGLDMSVDTAAEFASVEDQASGPSSSSTQLLLAWLPAAAAEAESRYESALQLYDAFLQSPVSSADVGVCLAGFVLEHMAACYAALGDWQGLTKLSRMHSSAAMPSSPTMPQQQQQHVFSTHNWMLGGSAALEALQHWEPLDLANSRQQHRGQQDQHGLSRGTAGRYVGSKRSEQQTIGSLDQSGLLHGPLTSLSTSERAILRAMVAHRRDSNDNSTSTDRAVDSRQRQRGRGRGRGRTPGVPQQHEQQEQYLQHHGPDSLAFTGLLEALHSVSSNPLFLISAADGGICPGDSQQIGPPSARLQELVVMHLLQAVSGVQQENQVTPSSISGLKSQEVLQTAIKGWLSMTNSQATKEGSNGSSLWAAALAPDGGLHRGRFHRLGMVLPLIQVTHRAWEVL